jgi:hypothetical protein
MVFSTFLIFAISLGGLALTYMVFDDEPLLWRFALGCVVGSALFGSTVFVLASVFGFGTPIVAAALAIVLLPLVLLRKGEQRNAFRGDLLHAREKIVSPGIRRLPSLAYFLFFFFLFLFFFDRVMIVTPEGIFTGGSQNLGDLPFHLGAIYSFTEGAVFPPENPSFAGAKFSYPFIADLVTACFVKLGADIRDAMIVQNVAWAFSLLVIVERFVFRLIRDRLAARIAPFLLFFSGGLGFVWFFSDYASQSRGLYDLFLNLQKDYTIGPDFRWGNSLVTLFMTQRSLLLGMPLTVAILAFLWSRFSADTIDGPGKKPAGGRSSGLLPFLFAGLFAGMLPLIHLHSLAVLFVVTAVLFAARSGLWREWLVFGAGVALIALPELLWSITGSATRASEFISRHFGWDSGETNFIWFWVKNTGVFIPLIAAGFYLLFRRPEHNTPDAEKAKKKTHKIRKQGPHVDHASAAAVGQGKELLLFYLPFALLFVIANLFKLAPWEWDNIKVLIYWYLGSIPFVAFALAWLWQRSPAIKAAAGILFFALVLSGALDVWRTVSGQINNRVFDADAVEIADAISKRTPADALFLNAPTYNTAVVLTGRRSLMRYPGHLSSHGIDYHVRESDIQRIYSGGPIADQLLEKYGVDHVLFGPEVQSFAQTSGRAFKLNEEHFKKYPVTVRTGGYTVYQIK